MEPFHTPTKTRANNLTPPESPACCGPSSSCDALITKPDANLICSVCLMLFDSPHRTKCGHVFCGRCIRGWIGENPACPACRAPVAADDLAPDRFAGAIVENLPSYCQLRSAGCPWVGTHGEVHQHLASSCAYVTVACPECDEEMPRHALAAHCGNGGSCQAASAAPRECPFGCGEKFVGSENMAQHTAECLMEPRKLLAALGHLQRENERLAQENLALRAAEQPEPGTSQKKRTRTRGPGVSVD